MLLPEERKKLAEIRCKIERSIGDAGTVEGVGIRRSVHSRELRIERDLLLLEHQSVVRNIFLRLRLEQQFDERLVEREMDDFMDERFGGEDADSD